ncbi:MAG: energy transducer TonB [Candidatus Poribacteria bacterium]|nr:energy transducer TonB [Candidatus Poribacteria bacterium]
MIKYKGRGGVNKFLGLAVAEHIVLILLFAIFVYQEPQLKVDRTPINVEILVDPEKDKKKNVEELPVINPVSQEFITPLELPVLHSSQDVQSYLANPDDSVGLPDLPQKRQPFQSNLDRTSLDTTASSGHKQGGSDINVDAPIRSRSVMEVGTYQASLNRLGESDSNVRVNKGGSGGRRLSGKLATGGDITSRKNRVSSGQGFRISGQVEGRSIVYKPRPPEIRKELQGGFVKLSFSVRPDGSVFQVRIIENRTGVLKQVAIEYISKFMFASLSENQTQIDQLGEIHVNFERVLK